MKRRTRKKLYARLNREARIRIKNARGNHDRYFRQQWLFDQIERYCAYAQPTYQTSRIGGANTQFQETSLEARFGAMYPSIIQTLTLSQD